MSRFDKLKAELMAQYPVSTMPEMIVKFALMDGKTSDGEDAGEVYKVSIKNETGVADKFIIALLDALQEIEIYGEKAADIEDVKQWIKNQTGETNE